MSLLPNEETREWEGRLGEELYPGTHGSAKPTPLMPGSLPGIVLDPSTLPVHSTFPSRMRLLLLLMLSGSDVFALFRLALRLGKF